MQFTEAWNKLRRDTKSFKTLTKKRKKKLRYDHFLHDTSIKTQLSQCSNAAGGFPTAINIQSQSRASAIKCLLTSYRSKSGCVILVWRKNKCALYNESSVLQYINRTCFSFSKQLPMSCPAMPVVSTLNCTVLKLRYS